MTPDEKPGFAPVGLIGRLGEGSKLRDLFAATDPDTYWNFEPPSGDIIVARAAKDKPPPTLPSKPSPTLPSKPHPKPAKAHAPAVANADSQTGPDHTPPYVDGDDGLETITGPNGDWDKKGPAIPCFYALAIAAAAGVLLAAAVFITLLAAMGWIG